ncbi:MULTISPECIES: hypothetical protein [unclassified Nonomuraea]|uniref:hypothetical protein n=1 Tax=unclassified Nonomuraea TaxID=2593643 RepID=UPI0033D5B298
MPMKTVFDVRLQGQLDQHRLNRFRKLLNLTPRGRLTDTEDMEFGNRTLRDTPEEWVWLTLWRATDHDWDIRLVFAGPPLPQPEITRCLAQILGAASALGLTVTRIWPEPSEPIPAPEPLELPTRRALSVRLDGERLGGLLDIPVLDKLQRALGLNREREATEFGWRYVRWDPPRDSVLLQVFDGPGGTEVTLLFDAQPPAPDVVADVRQRIAAAAEAGLREVG